MKCCVLIGTDKEIAHVLNGFGTDENEDDGCTCDDEEELAEVGKKEEREDKKHASVSSQISQVSPEARAKISAAMKKRWRKWHVAQAKRQQDKIASERGVVEKGLVEISKAGGVLRRVQKGERFANKNRKWSADEDAFLQQNWGKMRTADIARALRRSRFAIDTRRSLIKTGVVKPLNR